LIEGFKLVLFNERKWLTNGSEKLLQFEQTLLDYSNAKINALKNVLKTEKLNHLKLEMEKQIQNVIEKEIREDTEAFNQIKKNL
jgi:hypothetical protein